MPSGFWPKCFRYYGFIAPPFRDPTFGMSALLVSSHRKEVSFRGVSDFSVRFWVERFWPKCFRYYGFIAPPFRNPTFGMSALLVNSHRKEESFRLNTQCYTVLATGVARWQREPDHWDLD